jgi:cell division protein FtsN
MLLASCRGEPVPRDYQNAPPAMTHPPLKKSQTPSQAGLPGPAPEPSTGVEGANITRQPAGPTPSAPKVKDQAPVTTTRP